MRTTPTSWQIRDLAIELGLPLAAREQPLRVSLEADEATFDTASHRLELPAYAISAGDARIAGSMTGTLGGPATKIAGPFKLERTNLRRTLANLGVDAPASRDDKVFGAVELKGRLDYGPQGVALTALDGRLDDTRVTGALYREAGGPAALTFALDLDAIDIDRYLAPPGPSPEAPATAEPERPDALRALRAEGTLTSGRARLAGIELRKLRVRLRARDGVIGVNPAQAVVFGGQSSTQLTADLRRKVPKIDVAQRFTNVDLASLLRQTVKSERLTGRGSLTAQLSGSGSTMAQLSQQLRGTFETQVVNGEFAGVDLWNEIERALAIAQRREPPARPAAPRTPYDRFSARGQVRGTVLGVERFDVANDFLEADGRGTVDYRASDCDIDLTARLLRAPQGEIAGYSLGKLTGVDIPVTVRGKLTDPQVRPDVKRLLEAAAKQQLRREGEKVEKKLKEKVEDTLKDLLGQ